MKGLGQVFLTGEMLSLLHREMLKGGPSVRRNVDVLAT